MKKLIMFSIIIGSIIIGQKAFAMTPYREASLSFEKISKTQATVRFNYGMQGDAFANQIANRGAIKIQYRPWMCGDDPFTAPYTACPAIYIQPTVMTFEYNNNTNDYNGNLNPIVLNNLQPNTKYRVWLGYDNGMRCIQAPCESDTWLGTSYSFTTTPQIIVDPYPIVQILTQKIIFWISWNTGEYFGKLFRISRLHEFIY